VLSLAWDSAKFRDGVVTQTVKPQTGKRAPDTFEARPTVLVSAGLCRTLRFPKSRTLDQLSQLAPGGPPTLHRASGVDVAMFAGRKQKVVRVCCLCLAAPHGERSPKEINIAPV